jgi:hypothetical protein
MELTLVGDSIDKRDMGIGIVNEIRIEGELIRRGDTSSAALDPPALVTFPNVKRINWIAGAYLGPKSVGGIEIEKILHCDRDFDCNAFLQPDLASTDRAVEVGMRLIINAVVLFFDSVTVVGFEADTEACMTLHCGS